MSVENYAHSVDFSKSEELKYQVSELRYHLENVRNSIQEAFYHLKKSKHHASLIKGINKDFSDEVSYE